MAIDKSKWNLNIKVSQKTIDEIKKMGMTKALKTAAGSSAAARNNSDASAREWNEGLRRLYGADKVGAMGNTTGGPKSANTVTLKKPKGAYTKGATKSGSTVTTGSKSTSKSTPAKKTLANYNNDTKKLPNNMSTSGNTKTPTKGLTPQKVAGTALTIAGLVATRGKIGRLGGLGKVSEATLKAAKAAPKAAAATVKTGAKGSFGPTTKTLAKKGVGTPSEYASRAAQFGGPTNITVKKSLAKKAVANKAAAKSGTKTVVSKSKSGPGISTSIVKSGPNKGKIAKTVSGKYYSTTTYTKPKGGKK